jgi:hypothetical protein
MAQEAKAAIQAKLRKPTPTATLSPVDIIAHWAKQEKLSGRLSAPEKLSLSYRFNDRSLRSQTFGWDKVEY